MRNEWLSKVWEAKWAQNVTKIGAHHKSQQKAFFELKHNIFFAAVLTFLDLQQTFEIEIDAFEYVIGVLLT